MKQLIDDKDRKILEILQENSNLSTHKISKRTLIPVATVNNRINKLKDAGIIKQYTIIIDKKKLGFNVSAYILVTVSLAELKQEDMKMKDLIKIIKHNQFVESAHNVTGEVDIIIKMRMRDIDELNDYVVNTLSYYKGIEKTITALILKHN